MNHFDVSRRNLLGSMSAAGLWGQTASQASGGKKTILFVGADMGDAEWGAGGLMFKALKDGFRVVAVLGVSDWSNYPPAKGKEQPARERVLSLAKQMGIEKILLDYKYHSVPVDMEIKKRIAQIQADVEADIAVIQSESDYWDDHTNMARSAKDGLMFAHSFLSRAVRSPRAILAYPVGPQQTHDFRPDTFVDTTDVIERLAWLMNQVHGIIGDPNAFVATTTLHGPAAQGYPKKLDLTAYADQVLAAEKHWGGMCGVRYAEAFQSIQFRPRKLW